MSIPARIAWVAVVLVLIGGAVGLVVLTGDRSDAGEELQRAVAEGERLQDEAYLQDAEIDEAEEKETIKVHKRELCLAEMFEQVREWNRLLEEMPSVFYSTPEIQGYQDRAMALVDEARGAKGVCARI